MKTKNTIGLIDWGIGGLGVYKKLKKEIKNNSYLYFSDSGFTPYGKTSSKQLIRRLHRVTQFFREKNIRQIVIACNAASTVLPELQSLNPDIQFFGMLEAGKKSIQKSKKKSILVLGGKRTIQCRYFQKNFAETDIRLQALVAQPLSALIEKGQHKTKTFENEVRHLQTKTKQPPQLVLLACTHYPAAESVFKKIFREALILDPAIELVKILKKYISKRKTKSSTRFVTTGSVKQSQTSARKAFGLHLKNFQKVDLK